MCIFNFQIIKLKAFNLVILKVNSCMSKNGCIRCLLSRENLNSTLSASYIQMAITFDVLDRFQEHKALQTPHIMNNIPRSSKITEKVGFYTKTHKKLQFQSLELQSLLKRSGKVFYHNTKVIDGVFISCIKTLRGYHDTCGGYHEYRGGCSVPWGTQITKDFSPHGTEHPPRYS